MIEMTLNEKHNALLITINTYKRPDKRKQIDIMADYSLDAIWNTINVYCNSRGLSATEVSRNVWYDGESSIRIDVGLKDETGDRFYYENIRVSTGSGYRVSYVSIGRICPTFTSLDNLIEIIDEYIKESCAYHPNFTPRPTK
jgi:hypothetical protein